MFGVVHTKNGGLGCPLTLQTFLFWEKLYFFKAFLRYPQIPNEIRRKKTAAKRLGG